MVKAGKFFRVRASYSSRLRLWNPLLTALLFTLLVISGPLVSSLCSQNNEDCLMCHSQRGWTLFVDAAVLRTSAHRGLSCTHCHADIKELPHAPELKPVSCEICHEIQAKEYAAYEHGFKLSSEKTQAEACGDCHGGPHAILPDFNPRSPIHRSHVTETCGMCHGEIAAEFASSVHGAAGGVDAGDAPVCTDCHGSHAIASPEEQSSPVYPTSVPETCGRCHGDRSIASKYGLRADVVRTYEESFHGLALRYGSTRVANCVSCHGYHHILAVDDPASPVNPKHLADTCGKCHRGAGAGVTAGRVHSSPSASKSGVVRYVVFFYLLLITITICGMLFHDVIDFIKRAVSGAWARKSAGRIYGSRASQKIQYALLVASFAVLAYTGFALNRPEAWWTSPLRLFDNPSEARGLIHRIAAGVFILACLYHVFSVIATRRGREQFRALRPGVQDFRDFSAQLKYNVGLSRERPAFGRYDYVDKSEYWAMVWGSLIMTTTGLLLVLENLTLRFFPLWLSELATAVHFYEAVLAGLAAIVWHGYWTIFDSHGKR